MPTTQFGVIGWPVGHSASPAMMNAVFRAMDVDAYYGAFPVRAERIDDAIRGMQALGFGGVNVTIPHKQAVLPHAEVLTEEARLAGAANTLRFDPTTDTIYAHNTDVVGWWKSIQSSVKPEHHRVTILGAGGAARGILIALALYEPQLEVTMVARRPEQRDEFERLFQSRLRLSTVDWATRHQAVHAADIIVNTTPIGMWPNIEASPIEDPSCLGPHQVVEDIVYRPLQTRFLTQAQQAGALTVDGLWMLVYQGVAAVEFWLDVSPSADVMRSAALTFLGQ